MASVIHRVRDIHLAPAFPKRGWQLALSAELP